MVFNRKRDSASLKRTVRDTTLEQTSRNPASWSSPSKEAASPKLNRWSMIEPTRRSATGRSSRKNGLSSSDRHVLTATLPLGASARHICKAAAGLSGKNCTPCWQTTTSNRSPSRRGRPVAFPSRQSRSGATLRATASISGLTSTLATRPPCPSLSFATRATIPVPQAISSTRSPGAKLTSSRLISAQGQNIGRTRNCSYSSGRRG